MIDTSSSTPKQMLRVSVLELSHEEARLFFLKGSSYCDLELPPYFVFDALLSKVSDFLLGRTLAEFHAENPREHDDLNHWVTNNKDGKYAWRRLQLIHPAVYVSLVHRITDEQNWSKICERFSVFEANKRIKCLSLPVQSCSSEKDKAAQISHWWHEVEQKSIELSIDYEYLFQTDITDCYGSLYTHAIAWAMHGKPVAKASKKDKSHYKSLLGNVIDTHIQDMSNGQTNGIPQGSVLMDFVAELVLGYADLEISAKLTESNAEDYQILRYRDDYRIFVNDSQVGEKVVKAITEVLATLGFKLNQVKTNHSSYVVRDSIKPGKLQWIAQKQLERNLQKHLLLIYSHAIQFPNSSSLLVPLSQFHKRILRRKHIHDVMPLISIVVEIAYKNPRTYAISSAILSKLINLIEENSEKREILSRITKKFEKIPNTGYMEIWLQRISRSYAQDAKFEEPLCQLVAGEDVSIWNSDWLSSKELKRILDPKAILDVSKLEELTPVVPVQEVELFLSTSSAHSL